MFEGKKEYQVKGGSIVSIGGRLPYYLEVPVDKLLIFLVALSDQKNIDKSLKERMRKYLYARTKPGYYLEINENLHIAYADQRNGINTPHWWRLFFDDRYKLAIEKVTNGKALTVPGKNIPNNDNNFGQDVQTDVNPKYEWGGMYFRSKTEIKIAEELYHKKVLFFANSRGRISEQGSPISEASGWLTGRIEVDFLVFYKHKCMILEVDGDHHQKSEQKTMDYIRDRVLLREGIPTVRFTADECYNQTEKVVIEFLNMF